MTEQEKAEVTEVLWLAREYAVRLSQITTVTPASDFGPLREAVTAARYDLDSSERIQTFAQITLWNENRCGRGLREVFDRAIGFSSVSQVLSGARAILQADGRIIGPERSLRAAVRKASYSESVRKPRYSRPRVEAWDSWYYAKSLAAGWARARTMGAVMARLGDNHPDLAPNPLRNTEETIRRENA